MIGNLTQKSEFDLDWIVSNWKEMLVLLWIYHVWVLKERLSSIRGILSMNIVFHTKEIVKLEKTYNNGVCVKRSTSIDSRVDCYGKLEDMIELQYHIEHNRVLFIQMLLV
jgi:hypothetical protein